MSYLVFYTMLWLFGWNLFAEKIAKLLLALTDFINLSKWPDWMVIIASIDWFYNNKAMAVGFIPCESYFKQPDAHSALCICIRL